MGIKGLTNLLADEAPKSMKKRELKYYFGRTIAVDSNIWMYQFLTANGSLMNNKGQQTGHILGMLQRTVTLLEADIKLVYVFDGAPPELKWEHTIAERNMKRNEAAKKLGDLSGAACEDSFVCHDTPPFKKRRCDTSPSKAIRVLPSVGHKDGAVKPVIKHKVLCQDADEEVKAVMKRLVKPTAQQFDDCKQLFGLVGVPFVQAPGEGEAQCAQLCKEGKVLDELKLSQDEFIDFCILCGCDYCPNIEGMEAKTALDLIHKYRSIEKFLEANSYDIPKDWHYDKARHLFKKPTVKVNVPDLRWTKLNEEGLTQFLENENGFSKDNVKKFIERIKNAKERKTPQTRMERFFTPSSTSGRQ